MKYTSTINNVKCVEGDLTLSQAFLVELLVFAAAWAQRETIDGIDYYWVSRNKVLDEIPNAFKTADTVYRALVVLNEKGIIEYKKLGRKDVFRLTEKGKEWIFKPSLSEAKLGNKSDFTKNSEINPNELGNKSEFSSEINPTDKDTSNKDTSNKDTSNKDTVKKPQFAPDDFKPTDKQLEKMKLYGINAELLVESFLSRNKAEGKKYKCWNSALTTWINNEIKWGKLQPVAQPKPSHKEFEETVQPLTPEEKRAAFEKAMRKRGGSNEFA